MCLIFTVYIILNIFREALKIEPLTFDGNWLYTAMLEK